jgi:hypothetical protein
MFYKNFKYLNSYETLKDLFIKKFNVIKVNIFHILFVVPLFIIMMFWGKRLPKSFWAFIGILSIILIIYHLYSYFKTINLKSHSSQKEMIYLFHVLFVAPLLLYSIINVNNVLLGIVCMSIILYHGYKIGLKLK